MSKEKNLKGDKNIGAVEEVLSKSEHFIEKNQKTIMYVIGAIILVVGGYMAYNKFYMGPKEKTAQSEIFWAENYFGKDSVKLALNGDGTHSGFLDIIDSYGMTKSGNLAKYYAGLCYLKLGQFEEAIDNLKKFDSDDQFVNAMALGAIGDSYMELNDTDNALKYYLKAANNGDNAFTSPLFLMKAGSTYELSGNYTEAVKLYERIQKEYHKSYESREIEKYIARAKGLMGEK
ncbi:MAG TPA: tetratricopeptide repeat protein [Bacteroidales bacterium]|nr:tetratricopeptide repeat protein [Bacteroidales bacterium]HPS45696.1 tetratricopeptide repeat protein [Bacteroidales bacterium]HQH18070.1 tetratricopeptide repeat protein [Bacteroidales bacterium]HQI46457.1 tetratricopeptide repeat protein [Bacteroidales bacterium]